MNQRRPVSIGNDTRKTISTLPPRSKGLIPQIADGESSIFVTDSKIGNTVFLPPIYPRDASLAPVPERIPQ